MNFLNSKERKRFFDQLEKQYGYAGSRDYVVYEGGKDRYYFISRGLDTVPFEAFGSGQGGLYVATDEHGLLRLSLDGAILLGPECTAPRITLTREQRDAWMNGEQVSVDEELTAFRIVESGDDIVGCGKAKDGWLLNYVPKGRRIHEPH